MLSVLRGKLGSEPDEVRRRVELVQGDMRSERLGREFSLVIIPFRPMQHMYSVEDQLGALTTAREHLAIGGLFAFDVFFPMLSRVEGGIGEEYLDSEWPAADGSGRVHRRYFRKDAYDPVDLNFRGVFLHRLCAGDEVLEEEEQPLRMSVYTYPHLKLLFAAADLEIVEQYGTFDRTAARRQSEGNDLCPEEALVRAVTGRSPGGHRAVTGRSPARFAAGQTTPPAAAACRPRRRSSRRFL